MSQQEGPSTLTLSPHNIFPFLAPVALVCLAALPSCPMQPWRLSSHLPQYHPAKLQRRAVKGCQAPLKPQATASNEVPASGLHSCIQCSHLPAKGQSPGKSRPARMPHSLDMIPATVPFTQMLLQLLQQFAHVTINLRTSASDSGGASLGTKKRMENKP